MKDKINFTSKPVNEYTEDDTCYLQKSEAGYTHTFLLQFVSFSKGVITGKILEIQPNNQSSIWLGKQFYEIGSQISGSISKCYTYENGCHWFQKGDTGWACR